MIVYSVCTKHLVLDKKTSFSTAFRQSFSGGTNHKKGCPKSIHCCHPDPLASGEGSQYIDSKILHCVQNDKKRYFFDFLDTLFYDKRNTEPLAYERKLEILGCEQNEVFLPTLYSHIHCSFTLYMRNYLKRILFIFAFLGLSLASKGQCFPEITTFETGEKLRYEAYYNWGFIWLNAGWVTFEVKEGKYRERSVYFFDSQGESHKKYDMVFKVRDYYKAYFDKETKQPLYFNRKNYEGGYRVHNIYKFDHAKEKIYSFTENSDKPYSADTLDLPPCTFDLLSLVYYTRNIDDSELKVNDTIPLNTIIDNEFYQLYVRYLGKETITLRTGETYRCKKFSALLVEGTIFKGGEDMHIWVTDDENKIPVLVEAKILVGSVKAVLVDTQNLRHSLKAKVE